MVIKSSQTESGIKVAKVKLVHLIGKANDSLNKESGNCKSEGEWMWEALYRIPGYDAKREVK